MDSACLILVLMYQCQGLMIMMNSVTQTHIFQGPLHIVIGAVEVMFQSNKKVSARPLMESIHQRYAESSCGFEKETNWAQMVTVLSNSAPNQILWEDYGTSYEPCYDNHYILFQEDSRLGCEIRFSLCCATDVDKAQNSIQFSTRAINEDEDDK